MSEEFFKSTVSNDPVLYSQESSILKDTTDNYHTDYSYATRIINETYDVEHKPHDERSIVLYAYKCSIVGCNFISHRSNVTKNHEINHRIVIARTPHYLTQSHIFMCPYRSCYYISYKKNYWKNHMRTHKISETTYDGISRDTIYTKNVIYLYVCSAKKCCDFSSTDVNVIIFHRSVHSFIVETLQSSIIDKTYER